VELDGRTVSGGYRYGYQGSEKDDEVKGNGNSYTTEFRQLDPRLGRWLSVDPLSFKFPWQSTYTAFDNNPISLVDRLGSETEGGPGDGYKKNKDGSRSKSNSDGTNTYDAPGFSSVNLPANAKVLGTMQDVDKKPEDGAIYHNNVKYEASVGDLAKFEIDNVEYTAQFIEGKFTGYESAKGQEYISKTKANSNTSEETEMETITDVLGASSFANESKNVLIEYATKASNVGDDAIKYLMISEGLSKTLNAASILVTVTDGLTGKQGWQNHHTADLLIGAGSVFLMSGPWGWTIGGVYFLTDIGVKGYTGRSITENLFDSEHK
jgi:RHS repeat-associated protein